MNDWVNAAKGIAAIAALIAGAILYFAPMSTVEAIDQKVRRGEINQETVLQLQVMIMLKDKCDSGQCSPYEASVYETAKQKLLTLQEEKARLGGK